MKSGRVWSTLKQSFEANINENRNQSEFNENLCRTFNVPNESTLRENVVGKVFTFVVDEIKNEIGGNYIDDQTTDACVGYIVNLMIENLPKENLETLTLWL